MLIGLSQPELPHPHHCLTPLSAPLTHPNTNLFFFMHFQNFWASMASRNTTLPHGLFLYNIKEARNCNYVIFLNG